MRKSGRTHRDLSRNPEEEVVESVIFIGMFLTLLVCIPLAPFAVPYLFSLGRPFGVAGMIGGVLIAFFSLQAIISVPFALRDLSSPDQFRMFAKLVLVIDIGCPPHCNRFRFFR
jgi:hypothetical protein